MKKGKRRFRNWLIKKLGGSIPATTIDTHVAYLSDRVDMKTMTVDMIVASHMWDTDVEFQKRVTDQLAAKLGREILGSSENLISITTADEIYFDVDTTRIRMAIRVVPFI